MRKFFVCIRENLSSREFWYSLQGSVIIACLVIFVWVAWLIILPELFPKKELEPGTAGDMFGGLTALFSGLAFAGLISTLLMQGRELHLQREELAQTREVFSVQRFETTLFGLLRLLNDHVASIQVSSSGIVRAGGPQENLRVGRLALETMAQRLPQQTEKVFERDNYTGQPKVVGEVDLTLDAIIDKYESAYRAKFEIALGPYFRLLYNIFRLIDNAELNDDVHANERARKDYGRIVRAHLSSSEVKLMLFNGASNYGEKFRPWIIKYSLLKHLPLEDRNECSTLCAVFPPLAFGEG